MGEKMKMWASILAAGIKTMMWASIVAMQLKAWMWASITTMEINTTMWALILAMAIKAEMWGATYAKEFRMAVMPLGELMLMFATCSSVSESWYWREIWICMNLYRTLPDTCQMPSRYWVHTKVHSLSRQDTKPYSGTQITCQYIRWKHRRGRWKRRRSSQTNTRKRVRKGLGTLSSRMIALASDVRGRTWVPSRGLTRLFYRDLCQDLQSVFLEHREFVYS
jgi:hypothetical protein